MIEYQKLIFLPFSSIKHMIKPIVNITPNYLDKVQIRKLERAGYVVVVNFGMGGEMQVHGAAAAIGEQELEAAVSDIVSGILKKAVKG